MTLGSLWGTALPSQAQTAGAGSATGESYLVLYKAQGVPADAARSIGAAGGSVVSSYGAIGVVVARSASSTFRDAVARDSRVEGVTATRSFASRLKPEATETSAQPGDLPNAPATDGDSLSPLQWDMRQIKAPEAHAVTGGSPAVVVGDIDTGIDAHHPDLRQNLDVANSVSCIGGAPDQAPAAWADVNGHGTHTAGTIAAASNGIGIVGVAPNVRVAAVKAGDNDGYFFPEAVVCAFMWAGSHHFDVTNNSYFADPYLYNCRNDATQRAIWKAEQRAIRYAMNEGVTVVAAEGNESDDLSHPSVDVTSPDYPADAAQTRDVTNACVVVPVEVPGVVGVTADGNARQSNGGYLKSFYSSYGVSSADVVAPGGDSLFGKTPEAPNGRVLSTWPANAPCTRRVQETSSDPEEPTAVYCYLQGTSMASPHVAGVAALLVSRYGSSSTPQNGHMRPGQVGALLSQTADPQPCPDTLPPGYSDFTQTSGAPQTCQGGTGHNSWYGSGQVNALSAVTR
jgi:subtilisin family serine protease